MSSQMFDHLILPIVETHRLPCVAHDRRGFGKSEWMGDNLDASPVTYDVFVDDLAQVFKAAGVLKNKAGWIGIGSSMGAGELVMLLTRHPELASTCKGIVSIGGAMPQMDQSETNSKAPPSELWNSILQGFRDDRYGFTRIALPGVFGLDSDGKSLLSPTATERYERLVAEADVVAIEQTTQVLRATDFAGSIEKLNRETKIPFLLLHGDADQSMPVEAGPVRVQELMPRARLVLYSGGAHGKSHPS